MAARYAIFFPFLLIFLCSKNARAQKLSVGFSAGPSLSTLRFNDPPLLPVDLNFDPYDYKAGFIVALNGTAHFNPNTALRLEVNFERRGGTSGVPLSDGNGMVVEGLKVRDHFDYLQVPLLLQLTAGNEAMFIAHFGFSFDYLLHHTSKFPDIIQVRTPSQTFNVPMPSEYSHYDVSLIGGAGASLPMSDWVNLQVMARVNSGLRNLNTDETGFEVKNLSFALMATLQLTLW